MIFSSPALAMIPDITAKSAIHFPLDMEGTSLEKYSPQDERRLTDVLKQAIMKIRAIRILPYDGDISAAAADNMSAPVCGDDMKLWPLTPMKARAE